MLNATTLKKNFAHETKNQTRFNDILASLVISERQYLLTRNQVKLVNKKKNAHHTFYI